MTEPTIVHIAATARTAMCGAPMTQRDWAADPATTGPVRVCDRCKATFAALRRRRASAPRRRRLADWRTAAVSPATRRKDLLERAVKARNPLLVTKFLPYTLTSAEMRAEAERRAGLDGSV